MKVRTLIVMTSLLVGCASNPGIFETSDLGVDADTPDLGGDATLDAQVDADTTLDASADANLDASSDASLDAGSDAGHLDVLGQLAYVKASNTGANDWFGAAVALSSDGNTLAVSATLEDSNAVGTGGDQSNNTATDSGAVYVFRRTGTVWIQQAYLKASNSGSSDLFGTSLALSDDGDTLAVGARGEASAAAGIGGSQANNSASSSGAVYVFTRASSSWTQQAYVKASNTGADDWFGSSLAIAGDGNVLAIGAPREDSNGGPSDESAGDSGAVYVILRSGTTWYQQAYVKASNIGPGDTFGVSLALSRDGSTLAVGATVESSAATGIDGDGSNNDLWLAGAVYVLRRSGGTWTHQSYIKASNTDANDAFGQAVALSADGNTLVVGAAGEGSNATGVGGDQSNNSASNSGAVYAFRFASGNWSQEAYIKASNSRAFYQFGQSVVLSGDGNTLLVGAAQESSNATGINGDESDASAGQSGAVYLFQWSSGAGWEQEAYVKASNAEEHDQFGQAIAMSEDARTFAVGAVFESSSSTGIGGDELNDLRAESGAAYVFGY